MKMLGRLCLVAFAFFSTSCASNQVPQRALIPTLTEPAEMGPSSALPQAKAPELETVKPPVPNIPANPKTGLLVPPKAKGETGTHVPGQGKNKVVFEFDKADIAEVTNKIFQDYLHLNYVLDPTLQGRISLYIEGEYSNQELLALVTKAYAANYVSVNPRNGIYYIQPLQRAASNALPLADSFMLQKGTGIDRPVIVMYRMRYVDAKQAVNTVRPFLTAGLPVTVDAATNTVVFAAEADNAQTTVSILRALDMNLLKEVGMEVVRLNALTPQEAVTGMDALMAKLDIFKDSALKGNLAFLPLEHFGGVLVLAQNPEVLSAAKRWLQALDVQGQDSGDQINVYFVENGLATEIGDILSQMYGQGKEGVARRRPERRVVGSTQQEPQRTGAFGTGGLQQQSLQSQAGRTGAQGGSAFSTMLTGNVIIATDESNNAIVVRANPTDWARIKKSIQSLDIVPRAVLIEVMIAEVTLNDQLQYGVEWFLRRKGMDLAGYSGRQTIISNSNPGLTSNGGLNIGNEGFDLGKAAGGLTYFWGSWSGDIGILVNLLSSITKTKILSNPTLLASDNKEASITVGGRVPILTQQATNTASTGTIINNVQYEETGIILNVIPHINSGGLVRMDVEQTTRTVNQAAQLTGLNSPSFNERKVKTNLVAQNGSTVVIGGIIETTQQDTNTGIPVLKNIPVLSPLFSTKGKTIERTELIIAITPRVIIRHNEPGSTELLERLKRVRQQFEGEKM